MNKATITTREFLVEGGCNACGLQNCCTYTIHFADSHDQTMEDIDEASLVTALILKDGWRQGTEAVGIGDEAIFYKKGNDKVYLNEDGVKTVFEKAGVSSTYKKFNKQDRANLPGIFENANSVLKNYFDIPAYEFVMSDD